MNTTMHSTPVILIVPPTPDGCSWMDRSLVDVVSGAGSENPAVIMDAITAAQCGAPAEYIATSVTSGEEAQLCLAHAAAARVHPATGKFIATLRSR